MTDVLSEQQGIIIWGEFLQNSAEKGIFFLKYIYTYFITFLDKSSEAVFPSFKCISVLIFMD